MNEEQFINDFYKGNDYRKFAILQEIYRENFDLKNKLNEIKEIIKDCKKLMSHEFDWEEQTENILKIIEKVSDKK